MFRTLELCSALSLSRSMFVSASIITTAKLICNFHGTRAGAGRRDGGQTLQRQIGICCFVGRIVKEGETGRVLFFETLQRNKQAFLL